MENAPFRRPRLNLIGSSSKAQENSSIQTYCHGGLPRCQVKKMDMMDKGSSDRLCLSCDTEARVVWTVLVPWLEMMDLSLGMPSHKSSQRSQI